MDVKALSCCRPEKCGNTHEMLMKGVIAPSSQQEQVLGVAHIPHVASYALINACRLFFNDGLGTYPTGRVSSTAVTY